MVLELSGRPLENKKEGQFGDSSLCVLSTALPLLQFYLQAEDRRGHRRQSSYLGSRERQEWTTS